MFLWASMKLAMTDKSLSKAACGVIAHSANVDNGNAAIYGHNEYVVLIAASARGKAIKMLKFCELLSICFSIVKC